MMWQALKRLSEELIDAIAGSCTRSTLASLCLVSKQLNRICIPHLYAHLELHRAFLGEHDEQGCLFCLLPLAYQIFTSPSRAALVETVSLPHGWGRGTGPLRLYHRPAPLPGRRRLELNRRPWPKLGTPELENTLKTKCAEYALDDKEAQELYTRITSRDPSEVVVTLLLANLPNVQSLDLSFYEDHDQELITGMFERVGKRVKPFHAVLPGLPVASSISTPAMAFSRPVDVFVKGLDATPFRLLWSFFHLPRLRSIYAFELGEEVWIKNPFDSLRPRTCSVQHIELRNCCLRKEAIQCLMGAIIPGKLKTFLYDMNYLTPPPEINLAATLRSLEYHQSHLETLALDFLQADPSHEILTMAVSIPDNLVAASFASSYKSLRRLRVHSVFIWGVASFYRQGETERSRSRDMLWRALPETLEELWLTNAHHQSMAGDLGTELDFVPLILIPALNRVLEQRGEAFHCLGSIRIELPPHEWKDEEFDMLADFCRNAETRGIHCTIIANHRWRDVRLQATSHTPVRTQERGWGWNEDIPLSEVPIGANKSWRRHTIDAATEKDIAGTMRAIKSSPPATTDEDDIVPRGEL